MLISIKNKFIFIHNYKVAGTSIRKTLFPFCIKPYFSKKSQKKVLDKLVKRHFLAYYNNESINQVIKAFIDNIPDQLFEGYLEQITSLVPPHSNARQIKQIIPNRLYNDYFKFGFVRNPWDWQVSLYFYMLKDKGHYQHKLIKSFKSFDEFIEWRVFKEKRLQKSFFVDKKGNLIVDFIGRYENLNEDFQKVLQIVGLEKEIMLEHTNKSNHDNYMSYYNEYTYKLIEEHFKEDIEMFGY